MERNIMVELYEKSDVLDSVKGFEWDKAYTPIEMTNRDNEITYVFRGVATNDETITHIENLPCFYAWFHDTPIGPAEGIGPAWINEPPTNLLVGKINESSEKGEFQLFLLYCQNKGHDMSFYEKWIDKMEKEKPLAKPVYQKLICAFGVAYTLDKTDEINAIYEGITDKSRMKNFD